MYHRDYNGVWQLQSMLLENDNWDGVVSYENNWEWINEGDLDGNSNGYSIYVSKMKTEVKKDQDEY